MCACKYFSVSLPGSGLFKSTLIVEDRVLFVWSIICFTPLPAPCSAWCSVLRITHLTLRSRLPSSTSLGSITLPAPPLSEGLRLHFQILRQDEVQKGPNFPSLWNKIRIKNELWTYTNPTQAHWKVDALFKGDRKSDLLIDKGWTWNILSAISNLLTEACGGRKEWDSDKLKKSHSKNYRSRTLQYTNAICWSRRWHPTPVFLPGKSRGQRSLAGYSPRGHKLSDRTEQLSTAPMLFVITCWLLFVF